MMLDAPSPGARTLLTPKSRIVLEERAMGAQWKHAGRLASSAAKGKIFSKLAKEIIIAAKAGADPAMNARLRAAVEAAKKASMPRDTLERAIKKGAGLLDETVELRDRRPTRASRRTGCR